MPYTPRPYGYPFDHDYQKRTQTDRTKTGLLLLIIGLLVGPVPLVGIIGGILEILGAILVVLGRNAFGKPHSNYAIWSVIIYIVGSVVIIASAFVFDFSLALARLGTNGQGLTSDAISSAINTLLIGALVGALVTGFATVLFTYALQETLGRVLLWVGYVASLIVGIVVFSDVSSTITTVVQQALTGGIYNPAPISNLQARIRTLQLLGFVPALIYSAAYYLVWSRIGRGEIPSQGVEPSTLSSSRL